MSLVTPTTVEKLYCARGDMENRIKECQLEMFADRTSAATLRANQLRLHFASFAYVLMHGLRRLGLAGTRWANAQCGTIRVRWLKGAARVEDQRAQGLGVVLLGVSVPRGVRRHRPSGSSPARVARFAPARHPTGPPRRLPPPRPRRCSGIGPPNRRFRSTPARQHDASNALRPLVRADNHPFGYFNRAGPVSLDVGEVSGLDDLWNETVTATSGPAV